MRSIMTRVNSSWDRPRDQPWHVSNEHGTDNGTDQGTAYETFHAMADVSYGLCKARNTAPMKQSMK